MNEIHHKVPVFLGGSNDEWNLETISIQDHFNRHINIAEEVDTFEAWSSVILFIPKLVIDKKTLKYIKKRHGNKMRGNTLAKGKVPWNKGKKHSTETIAKIKAKRTQQKPPMLGKNHTQETKDKLSNHFSSSK